MDDVKNGGGPGDGPAKSFHKVLRFWGHFSFSWEWYILDWRVSSWEETPDIHILGYEYVQVEDQELLRRTHSYPRRYPEHVAPKFLRESKGYIPLQRHKWLNTGSQQYRVEVSNIDIGNGVWMPMQAILWHNTWVPSFDNHPVWGTVPGLRDAAEAHFRRSLGTGETQGALDLNLRSTLPEPDFTRRRRRRQARRHQTIEPSLPKEKPDTSKAWETIDHRLRGRQRRKQRRHAAREACSSEPEHHLASFALERPRQLLKSPEPPWATDICHLLLGTDQRFQQGLVAVPIKTIDSRLLGCLIVPSKGFRGDKLGYLARVKRVCVHDGLHLPNYEYWAKFPFELHLGRRRVSNILKPPLVGKPSFASPPDKPPLHFPDQKSVVATQYLKIFVCHQSPSYHDFLGWMRTMRQSWGKMKLHPHTENEEHAKAFPLANCKISALSAKTLSPTREAEFTDNRKIVLYYSRAIVALEKEHFERRWKPQESVNRHVTRELPNELLDDRSLSAVVSRSGTPKPYRRKACIIEDDTDCAKGKGVIDDANNGRHSCTPPIGTRQIATPHYAYTRNMKNQSPLCGWPGSYYFAMELKRTDKDESIEFAEKAMFPDAESSDEAGKPRDILIGGANHYEHVPFFQQEIVCQHVCKIIEDDRHHYSVAAHAQYQLAIHLLSGFGCQQDVELGLHCLAQAAINGNRTAQALTQRMSVAYGRSLEHELKCQTWLAREAANGSFWALDELRRTENELYDFARGYYFISSDQHPVSKYQGYEEKHIQNEDMPKLLTRLLQMIEEGTPQPQNADAQDNYYLALRFSCAFGSLDVVATLLDACDRNSADVGLSTNCLRIALGCGRLEVSRLIMKKRREVLVADFKDKRHHARNPRFRSFRGSPLFLVNNLPDSYIDGVVRDLIDVGFDVNSLSDLGECAFRLDGFSYYGEGATYDDKTSAHGTAEVSGRAITPLRWALMLGNASLVKALIANGAEFPVAPDAEGYARMWPKTWSPHTPTVRTLGEPCYNIDILRFFLQQNAKQEGEAPFAETPLGLIVMEPDSPSRRLRNRDACLPANLFPILSLLRSYQPGSDGQLLWAAVRNNHIEVVQYLLEHQISTELRFQGLTPLHTSALYGRLEIFQLLLAGGADPHATTTDQGISVMHLVFWIPKSHLTELAMVRALYQIHGQVSGSGGEFGKYVQPIHLAVLNCRLESTKLLLDLGANPHETLKRDATALAHMDFIPYGDWFEEFHDEPLALAGSTSLGIILARVSKFPVREVVVKMIWLLLGSQTQDISRYYTRPGIRQTALHLLACTPDISTSSVDAGNTAANSGLFVAILKHGADAGLHIDITDTHGDTPLHYASMLGASQDWEMINLLLSLGANSGLLNKFGSSPMTLRLRALDSLSKQPGQLRVPRTWLTFTVGDGLTSSPLSSWVDELNLAKDLLSPWPKPESEGESSRETNFGRAWDCLRRGIPVDKVWDMEKHKWVSLPDPIRLQIYTADCTAPYKVDCFEHMAVRFPDE